MSKPFEHIDLLKSEWDALQPLSPGNERRLWQKLRLEWNYHSNHIEGNTLTYGETALLLLHGQTHGDHAMREYEEMKAHDVGIEHLRLLASDSSRLITEADIRNLNRIILKEPFWKPTQTADGQPTRSQVIPGDYKTQPNSVITATGELFEYTAPIDVPARMQALVAWLAEALERRSLHLVEIAAKLHYDFVLVHPFDDGNGRVARMLVNYLLLQEGYPPLIVPTNEKNTYLASLRLADAGDLSPLADFLGRQLERSLRLGIRAAKGESIEEPSDVEKQVAIFVRSEQARNQEREMPSEEVLANLGEVSILPFVEELEKKLKALDPLFKSSNIVTQNSQIGQVTGHRVMDLKFLPKVANRIVFRFEGYRGESLLPFNHSTVVELHFPLGHYTITHDAQVMISRSYSEPLFEEEIDQITSRILAKVFDSIKAKATPKG
jgi:Fic family protein